MLASIQMFSAVLCDVASVHLTYLSRAVRLDAPDLRSGDEPEVRISKGSSIGRFSSSLGPGSLPFSLLTSQGHLVKIYTDSLFPRDRFSSRAH